MRRNVIVNQASLKTLITQVMREFEDKPYIKTGVSNRHLHLSAPDLERLFGAGYTLTPVKELQPGQYACKETVRVAGKKGKIENVRILGPLRKATQLELSLTDTFTLGIDAPVNESGCLDGAATVTLERAGVGASIERACAIVALRHVHLCPSTAERLGIKDKQFVSLVYGSGARELVFRHVLVRVSPDFEDEIHLDTDEANAGGIKNGDLGLIEP
ncbi:MAG: phosphate propanoyltransferase [Spirochaetaceae bacterium]|jgi:putative phosphotransacetylase|nr:phosphate propanoyltransferase [Spirochaetaceae bacterium]